MGLQMASICFPSIKQWNRYKTIASFNYRTKTCLYLSCLWVHQNKQISAFSHLSRIPLCQVYQCLLGHLVLYLLRAWISCKNQIGACSNTEYYTFCFLASLPKIESAFASALALALSIPSYLCQKIESTTSGLHFSKDMFSIYHSSQFIENILHFLATK